MEMLDHGLHAMIVVVIGMRLNDELKGFYASFPKEFKEFLAYAVPCRQETVDQAPSVTRQPNEYCVSVSTMEEIDIDRELVRIRWVR